MGIQTASSGKHPAENLCMNTWRRWGGAKGHYRCHQNCNYAWIFRSRAALPYIQISFTVLNAEPFTKLTQGKERTTCDIHLTLGVSLALLHIVLKWLLKFIVWLSICPCRFESNPAVDVIILHLITFCCKYNLSGALKTMLNCNLHWPYGLLLIKQTQSSRVQGEQWASSRRASSDPFLCPFYRFIFSIIMLWKLSLHMHIFSTF